MLKPDRLNPQGSATWWSKGPITDITRNPNGTVTLTGADRLGNPTRIDLTQAQAMNLGYRITSAAHYDRPAPGTTLRSEAAKATKAAPSHARPIRPTRRRGGIV